MVAEPKMRPLLTGDFERRRGEPQELLLQIHKLPKESHTILNYVYESSGRVKTGSITYPILTAISISITRLINFIICRPEADSKPADAEVTEVKTVIRVEKEPSPLVEATKVVEISTVPEYSTKKPN